MTIAGQINSYGIIVGQTSILFLGFRKSYNNVAIAIAALLVKTYKFLNE